MCKHENKNKLTRVGMYIEAFNTILNIHMPCLPILQSSGLIKHIEKRHPNCLVYIDKIPQMIKEPDYIGINGSIPDSIELVKQYGEALLLGIILDEKNGYYYVSSLYEIKEQKIKRRENSGRLKRIKTDD